jgi:hypothetical protein
MGESKTDFTIRYIPNVGWLSVGLRLSQKTIISKTIKELFDLPDSNQTKVEFFNEIVNARLLDDFQPVLTSVLDKVSINSPLDFLDLLSRISPGMSPGTFNFFSFSTLFDLTQNNKTEMTNYSNFVNALISYKDIIFNNPDNCPRIVDIISRSLAQENVFCKALELLDLTELSFCAYNALSI